MLGNARSLVPLLGKFLIADPEVNFAKRFS
jgi:hypothetical protein